MQTNALNRSFDSTLGEHHPTFPSMRPKVLGYSCSIILPAFNEEAVIEETVRTVVAATNRFCPRAEIIVVNDGSRDTTRAILDRLGDEFANVVPIHHPENRGYGSALCTGFDAARGELAFFMDSDGQFDINDLTTLLAIAAREPNTIVLGYRAQRCDPFMRKLNAAGWKQLTRIVVGLRGIRDIDCAFKLFPSALIKSCDIQAGGATVNAEFLTKFQLLGIPIIQVPVTHMPRTKGSPTGAKPEVILRACRDIFRLRGHLRLWHQQQMLQRQHKHILKV